MVNVSGLLRVAPYIGRYPVTLRADYKLSLEQGHRELAIAIIAAERALDILSVPRHSRTVDLD